MGSISILKVATIWSVHYNITLFIGGEKEREIEREPNQRVTETRKDIKKKRGREIEGEKEEERETEEKSEREREREGVRERGIETENDIVERRNGLFSNISLTLYTTYGMYNVHTYKCWKYCNTFIQNCRKYSYRNYWVDLATCKDDH